MSDQERTQSVVSESAVLVGVVLPENAARSDDLSELQGLAQAAGTTCFYLILVNAAGAYFAINGKDDETTDLPGVPDDYCLIGIIKIVTVGVTFTIGTTAFDAAGITDTFYDFVHAPVSAPS